jgi:hypothetical protein
VKILDLANNMLRLAGRPSDNGIAFAMKAVILAGGLGTRISEETHLGQSR